MWTCAHKATPCVLGFASLWVMALPSPSPADTLTFQGHVEAVHQADVYSRAEGIVVEVMAQQGVFVEAGTPLVKLQQDLAELEVDLKEAKLSQADALLQQAKDRLRRAERLSSTGAASDVATNQARTELALAQAQHALARTEVTLAQTALADTVIRAPIDGYVEDPRVRVGSLLEFSSGDPPLFQIVNLDPVRVVYEVPYTSRLTYARQSDAQGAASIPEDISIQILASDGQVLRSNVVPDATAVWVDPETDTIRVWATIGNEDGVLRPGMQITVLSDISSESDTTLDAVSK